MYLYNSWNFTSMKTEGSWNRAAAWITGSRINSDSRNKHEKGGGTNIDLWKTTVANTTPPSFFVLT